MQLVVLELQTVVRQKITIGSRALFVGALRPYIFRYLSPAGYAYLEIQDSAGRAIKQTNHVTIAGIGTGNYWHGYQEFAVDLGLAASADYYVALKSGGGYTFDEAAYLGWCNAFDLKNAFDPSYSSAVGMTAPLGLQLWEYRNLNKGGL